MNRLFRRLINILSTLNHYASSITVRLPSRQGPCTVFTTVTFVILLWNTDGFGQLQRFPLPGQAKEALSFKVNNSSGRTKELPPAPLPFWDDFSKPFLTSQGFSFPDTARWVDSNGVWVSDGMGINPPTINIATLDGLDEQGDPYSPNDALSSGYSDTLTSKPLDLSVSKIGVAERPGVFLSFFYQWSGHGEGPDAKDFLQVDFKSADANGWTTVMRIFPGENPRSTTFYDTIIQVSGEQFFHGRFQFRLISFGRQSGPFDAWNVDYVYLNKNRHANDLSFPDRALSTQLGPLFGKYRAIPRRHFFSNAQLSAPTFEIQNLKNVAASINFRTEGLFSSTDFGKDTTTYQTVISKATPINITDNVILANEHKTIRMDTLPDINNPLQFPTNPGIDSTLIRLTIALQTNDNVPLNNAAPVESDSTGDYTPNYRPIKFTSNDTLTADYALSSYYAYDDGVAEYSAGLIEAGNLIAYQFDIDTTYSLKQDTLIGFDVYFPPYGFSNGQRVDFFIYRDNNGLPGDVWLTKRSVALNRSGNNRFQRINFLPALLVDSGRFYIGWKQPFSGEVLVGLDMSNDTSDKIFVNTNEFWYQNVDVHGSLMIRPLFGSGIIDSRVAVEEEEEIGPEIFPNPSFGTFYIEGRATVLQIISVRGEKVGFESHDADTRTEVRVQVNAPGLYIVRYRRGNVLRSQKIIISR